MLVELNQAFGLSSKKINLEIKELNYDKMLHIQTQSSLYLPYQEVDSVEEMDASLLSLIK